MCSHWSCPCSSYRALHSVEEKRGSWQEQGSKETLAEVWSRRVSVASAQSSPFSGPWGWIWKQCSRQAMEMLRLYQQLLPWSSARPASSPVPASSSVSALFPVSTLSPVPALSSVPASSPLSRSSLWSPSSTCSVLGTAHCFITASAAHHVAVECLPLSLLSGSFTVLWQTSISSHRFELELPGEAPWGETGVSLHCTNLGFGTCEATPVGRVPFGQTQGSTPAADFAGRGVNMGTG